MKKYLILFWIIALASSLLATQIYVVGEVFTATWCGFCPVARSALRQMYEQSDEFEFLIPLLWQQDGPYPSPNYSPRTGLYGVSGIPHGQWGGYLTYIGGGDATYPNYVQRYNQVVINQSPIELDLDFEVTDQNQLVITANAEMLAGITTTNNKILFIVSYNLDAEQPGDYFASVIRYNEQTFPLTSAGQTGVYNHTFNIDTWWDLAKAHAIVIIQTFDGNKVIHQAASVRLSELVAPANLVGYTGNSQATLSWDAPDTALDILGYNIYRDDAVINDQPHGETSYIDTGLENEVTYSYYITAVYDEAESGPSNIVAVTPFDGEPGLIQIGSGTAINGTTAAAPINIYYRSQRGQMVYTADEINLAGFQGEGELTHIGFYVHAAPIHALPSFHIRIKHTAAIDAGSHDNGPFEMTQVIASYAPTPGGWDIIELTEPFQWNGVDNILIDTAFDLVPNWNASGQQRVFNIPNGYRYSWSDTVSQVDVVTANVVGYKPQIRLQFIGEEPPPELPAPQNLVAEAGDGVVDLLWDVPEYSEEVLLLGYHVYRDGSQLAIGIIEQNEYADTDVENGITYSYYVTAVYVEGESEPSNSVEATPEEETDVSDDTLNPLVTMLRTNYPNPFNPETTIQFSLQEAGEVTIEIFNISGQKIRTLVNGNFESGYHNVIWNGRDDSGLNVGSGIYFYRMVSGKYVSSRKMILLK
ncbi:MAG: T9SS type A sorting domain-containing protein [Candidatus Cloacimonetes bacterium]|nr:T9SS type A sorting domain-containing protein [Candidatus Cloacimonadota bacterium]